MTDVHVKKVTEINLEWRLSAAGNRSSTADISFFTCFVDPLDIKMAFGDLRNLMLCT